MTATLPGRTHGPGMIDKPMQKEPDIGDGFQGVLSFPSTERGLLMFASWLHSLRRFLGHTAMESRENKAGHTTWTAGLARRKKRLARPSFQPTLEPLEGRVTPSTITIGAARDNSIFS